MRPYRIPDKLKAEVDRQVDQLLKDGKIRPSSSPYAHPIHLPFVWLSQTVLYVCAVIFVT